MAGVVHDTAVAPSTQDRATYGYVTPATAALIGQSTELDQLLVKIKNRGDMSDATSFANDLRDWLKANGESPLRADVVPDEHPHAGLMATMLRVLQAFAAIAFTCSAALALYMVSLWMKREVRQVGIMKSIGARSSQLAAQYLGLVVPLVMAANAVAWPLGTWLGRWLVRYYETVFNIDVAHWGAPSSLLFKEILCTLGIPLLAMSVPIVRAARMTAREAIHDPGITAPGSGLFSPAKWLKIPGHRQWTFAFRNIFRRPWRLAMILLALSAGGALFLTANNTYESLMRVVDVSLGNQGHDIQVQLQRPASAAQLESIARTVPEVEIAEAWRTAGVTIGKPGGAESQRLVLLGYPADTRLFRLPIKEGRLPAAGESDAVVVNRLVQNAVPGVRPGSELELHFRERRVKVRVVGIVEEIGTATLYAAYPAFESHYRVGRCFVFVAREDSAGRPGVGRARARSSIARCAPRAGKHPDQRRIPKIARGTFRRRLRRYADGRPSRSPGGRDQPRRVGQPQRPRTSARNRSHARTRRQTGRRPRNFPARRRYRRTLERVARGRRIDRPLSRDESNGFARFAARRRASAHFSFRPRGSRQRSSCHAGSRLAFPAPHVADFGSGRAGL